MGCVTGGGVHVGGLVRIGGGGTQLPDPLEESLPVREVLRPEPVLVQEEVAEP